MDNVQFGILCVLMGSVISMLWMILNALEKK